MAIFYTISTQLDGDDNVIPPPEPTVTPGGGPGLGTQVYGGALTIGQPTRIKAMNVRNAGAYSAVSSVYYSLTPPPPSKCDPATFLPSGGVADAGHVFPGVRAASATAGGDVTIHYILTTNGTIVDPLDVSGNPVGGAASMGNGATFPDITVPTTIGARVKKPGWIFSDLTSADFTEAPPPDTCLAPILTPPNYTSMIIGETIPVVIKCGTPGVTVYFTRDSSPPLAQNGTPVFGAESVTLPIGVGGSTIQVTVPCFINAVATKSGLLPSVATQGHYQLVVS